MEIIQQLSKLTFSCEGVILTKRSVGRISRWDFAIDIARCLTFAPAGVDRWFTSFNMTNYALDNSYIIAKKNKMHRSMHLISYYNNQ